MVKQVIRRRLRSERGAELIELAIVLPILLLVFAGIVDFALAMQRFVTLNNAAREGARIAVLPGYTQTDVQNRVTQYVREGTGDPTASPTTVLTNVSIAPSGPAPAFPAAQVTVTLTHSYLFLGPVSGLLGGGSFSSITLTSRSTMRIES
ncbi:MAG TPA: TadE/TadG family type IV pilus assembly protein [Vicinamibacterales bacterium]|nr:TadE/TadG family type IV pilus assembly protein [Vicinamibacterales bacterium]